MLVNHRWGRAMLRKLSSRQLPVHPLRCQLLARRGCCDGRDLTCWALNVSRGRGQIRVAKGFCSFVRKNLGSLAMVAEFRLSCASVGRTRLPCNCCVVPPLDSAMSNEPRLRPGDPAVRSDVRQIANLTCVNGAAGIRARGPKNLPPFWPFTGCKLMVKFDCRLNLFAWHLSNANPKSMKLLMMAT